MDTIEGILLRYFQNEFTEDDLDQINKWLKESPENMKEFFLMEAAYKNLNVKRFSEKTYLDNAKRNLDCEINKYELSKNKASKFRHHFIRYVAIATVLLAVAFSIFLTKTLSLNDDMIVVTAGDSIKEVLLSDGTRVWLNKNAVLKYPQQFDSDTRTVYLEKEGYFEVAKDREKPFVVESESMQIRVLGTAFNLDCSEESDVSIASLIEGKIEVKSNISGGSIILSPGQNVELNKKTGHMFVTNTNSRLAAIWHNNLIPFEKVTIFEIAETLAEIYDVTIVVSRDVSKSTYSGILKKKSDVKSALTSLKNSIPIDYKIREDSTVYIHAKKK